MENTGCLLSLHCDAWMCICICWYQWEFSCKVKFTLDFAFLREPVREKDLFVFAIDFHLFSKDWFLWEIPALLTLGLWKYIRAVLGFPNNNPANVSGAENSISILFVAIQDFNLKICRKVAVLQGRKTVQPVGWLYLKWAEVRASWHLALAEFGRVLMKTQTDLLAGCEAGGARLSCKRF